MNKICIVDLDGVIANVEKRFARAEEAKAQYLSDKVLVGGDINNIANHEIRKAAENVYWKAVFDPEQVPTDTLIDGADDAIEQIEEAYQVLYLTSRPESMRAATHAWLAGVHLDGPKVIHKPASAQYVKTIVWKALTIQMFATFLEAEELLVIDDEVANIQELEKYRSSFKSLTTASSLAEAVRMLQGETVEHEPY